MDTNDENILFLAWTGETVEVKEKPVNKTRRRQTELIAMENRYLYRRAFSESKLLDCLGMEPFKEGYAYHFITAGDVDSLSYLKLILRYQDLEYCLASTWCMAGEDVLQFDEWLTKGKIKKLDFYVGEIFPSTYYHEWVKLNEIFEKHQCGRIAVFRNHSKIYAGYSDKFYFGIETSANINTNPRTENGCITIDKELFEFYKSYFDGIISFDVKNART